MIVVLSPSASPELTDLDRFDRLHAELQGDLAAARLGELCRSGDDEHVWIDIAAARVAGTSASADPTFTENYDAMIAYATSSGWTDEAGTHVRAHVVRPD